MPIVLSRCVDLRSAVTQGGSRRCHGELRSMTPTRHRHSPRSMSSDGLERARQKLASARSAGFTWFEPAGQDGRRCQLLAYMDQAERCGCWPRGFLNVDSVEAGMIGWLQSHAADVTITAVDGDSGVVGRRDDAWIGSEVDAMKHD